MTPPAPNTPGPEPSEPPPDDLQRYHRQVLLPFIGPQGQRRLAGASVLVVGCGALGSVVAELLTRAGIGRLRLADRDVVEPSNLHRQGLFDLADARDQLPKVEAAARRLAAINPAVHVEALPVDVGPANARPLTRGIDVLVDATDNFETRFLLNDLAVLCRLPLVYGGVVGDQAVQLNILPATADRHAPWEQAGGATACLRCIFGQPPPPGSQPTCDTAGVLGPLAWLVASAQAIETMKMLTGQWAAVERRMRRWTGWSNTYTTVNLAGGRDDLCPCCGQGRFDYLDGQAASQSTSICGRLAVQVRPAGTPDQGDDEQDPAGPPVVDFDALARRWQAHGPVTRTAFSLRTELQYQGRTCTLTLFPDGRAIIHGTRDPAVARSLYSRYVGL